MGQMFKMVIASIKRIKDSESKKDKLEGVIGLIGSFGCILGVIIMFFGLIYHIFIADHSTTILMNTELTTADSTGIKIIIAGLLTSITLGWGSIQAMSLLNKTR